MKHQKIDSRKETIMKHQKMIGTVLTVCVLLLSLVGCTPGFEGNSVKNADSYALDIEAMNGTDSHTLELEQGDILQIQFETVKGSLFLKENSFLRHPRRESFL